MARAGTADRIVAAAERLFYSQGIARVSLDAVAEKAGVTKRTLYYHFRSKDDLTAAYLARRDQPNLALFEKWFREAEGSAADRTRAIFANLARSAQHPKWKGCGFLRTSVELAHMPGHPAIRVGAAHKKKFEAWMAAGLEAASAREPLALARHVVLLLDGAFATSLLHRDPAYIESAGDAAHALIAAALTPGEPERARTGAV